MLRKRNLPTEKKEIGPNLFQLDLNYAIIHARINLKFVDQWAPRNMARAPNVLFQEPKGLPKKFLRQQPCTVTLLLRPLFLAAWQNSHKFLSWKKPLLIRSPINTANFVGPLVTVLTGFHFNRSLQYRFTSSKMCILLVHSYNSTMGRRVKATSVLQYSLQVQKE